MLEVGLQELVQPLITLSGETAMLSRWDSINCVDGVMVVHELIKCGQARAMGLVGRDWGDDVQVPDDITNGQQESIQVAVSTGRRMYSGGESPGFLLSMLLAQVILAPVSKHEHTMELIQAGF